MLSADLVRARRRGDTLQVQKLKAADRVVAEGIAEDLLVVAKGSLGKQADEVTQELSAIDRESRHEKLWAGLKKLVLDECQFGMPLDVDAPALRKEIFETACSRRQNLKDGEAFDRDSVVSEIAQHHDVDVHQVEDGLFGDLKGAQRLTEAPVIGASQLVDRYELAQVQGVLLKAIRLNATVKCENQDAYRRLFQKLKFRQLLYRLSPLEEGGYEIEIEGPFSLFESVTKYGLQLALIVPALLECESVELTAQLRWGKERKPLTYQASFQSVDFDKQLEGRQTAHSLRPDVSQLLGALAKKKNNAWTAAMAHDLLDVPGEGLCIPDLVFEQKGRQSVYLEVLGYWSRDAVWKRVEWAQSKNDSKVIFAISSRLRVSEEVLPKESGSMLYVYKGSMSAPAILKQVEELSEHTG